MTMRNGIHMESELKKYMAEAQVLAKIRKLTRENIDMKSKIKSNSQEISKLLGVADRYENEYND